MGNEASPNREVKSKQPRYLVQNCHARTVTPSALLPPSFLGGCVHVGVQERVGEACPSLLPPSSPSPSQAPLSHPLSPPIKKPSFHHNDRQKGLGKHVPKAPQGQRA